MTAAAGGSTMCYSTDSAPSASTYCHELAARGLSDHSALRGGLRSAAGGDDVVALGAQHLDHHVAVISLQFDHSVLDGTADAAALLELARRAP